MRTSIATVCLSGTLTDKLHAAADAGFDGVEIFEPDLVASPASPEEIVALAARLGLTLDLYQPFRDAEGVTEAEFEGVLRRARAKFALMQRLGMDTMLVCSNVATATIDDDDVSAVAAAPAGRGGRGARRPDRLRGARLGPVRRRLPSRLADRRARGPRRRRDLPRQLPHPLPGPRPCRDRGHPGLEDLLPPARRRAVADHGRAVLVAPPPAVPRRGRLRPRHLRGPRPPRRVRRAALARGLQRHLPADRRGPDRPPGPALAHLAGGPRRLGLRRGAPWPTPRRRLPAVAEPSAFDFVEVRADDTGEVDVLLGQLGFTFRGRHRSKDARLWTEGPARVVCNEQHARDRNPTLASVGFEVADPGGVGRPSPSAPGPARLPPHPRQRAGAPRLPGPRRHRGLPRPRRRRRTTLPGSRSSRAATTARRPC